MMASSRECLLEDEIEQSLLGELTASDQVVVVTMMTQVGPMI